MCQNWHKVADALPYRIRLGKNLQLPYRVRLEILILVADVTNTSPFWDNTFRNMCNIVLGITIRPWLKVALALHIGLDFTVPVMLLVAWCKLHSLWRIWSWKASVTEYDVTLLVQWCKFWAVVDLARSCDSHIVLDFSISHLMWQNQGLALRCNQCVGDTAHGKTDYTWQQVAYLG